ncbi:diguanylate cyclase [Parafrankia sp. EUN1f]|nr:diguanylate cyclase [Parafrankia sp. EUN1f]
MFRWAAACCALLLGLAATFAALLPANPARIATLAVAFASEFAVAFILLYTARRAADGDRRWRLLIGVFAVGHMGGGLVTLVTLLTGGSIVSRVTTGVIVVFYGPALAGMLSLPTSPVDGLNGRARGVGRMRWHAIVVLDSTLIVGSILLVEWVTSLGAVARASSPNPAELLLALVHQITGLILAATVLLIATFRRPRSPTTLVLLGGGLLAYALTSVVLVYQVAYGRHDLPAWSLLPLIASVQLLGLAALVPAHVPAERDGQAVPSPRAMWAHAALPYTVLAVAGTLVLGRLAAGAPLDRVEAYGTVSLLVLALTRQMITIAENTHLLTALREREEQLHYQAFHDPLTGLANRELFARRLRQAVGPSPEPDNDDAPTGHETVSVLFIDLDHFKAVNDAFGHAAGDELLKISADRLQNAARSTDTVARFGGDEFAVILIGSDPDTAVPIAQRLATAVQTPCHLADHPYRPRASLGLATLDHTTEPACPDTLLHHADLAMYAAKRRRTRGLVVYDPTLTTHHDQPRHP